jgi:RecA-family ATPase
MNLREDYGFPENPSQKIDADEIKVNLKDLGYFLDLVNSSDDELLKHRFLCRKGTLMINAPTGIGKSVLTMQSAITWAINRPSLGILPSGYLKSLIIQGENDDYDLKEMISGTLQASELTEEEKDIALKSIKIITEKRATGQDLMEIIRVAYKEFKADLIWIDPLFQYIGGNVSDQQVVSEFLRNQLSPLLEELNVGCIILHHTNKPPTGREKGNWKPSEFSYAGSGSMELANFPRAVVSITATGDSKRFQLKAPKRGRRIGWKDQLENIVVEIPIKHSDGKFPYWEKEIPNPDELSLDSSSRFSLTPEDLMTVMSPEGLRHNEWKKQCIAKFGTSGSTFKRRFDSLRESNSITYDVKSERWIKAEI